MKIEKPHRLARLCPLRLVQATEHTLGTSKPQDHIRWYRSNRVWQFRKQDPIQHCIREHNLLYPAKPDLLLVGELIPQHGAKTWREWETAERVAEMTG